MSRYRGPRLRKLRRLGAPLVGLTPKTAERRPQPPGQHGGRRRRQTDYARMLVEKQKLRAYYGLTEQQLRRMMREARAGEEASSDKLLGLLERRLDNVVFRAGFARTIPAARQLITHGHFRVAGRPVDVPSYRVRAGEVIDVRERSRSLQVLRETLADPTLPLPDWLSVEPQQLRVRVESLPDPQHVPLEVDVRLVVEFYAQRL